MQPAFSRMLQIGIIVRDLEKTIAYFEPDFGIGPWRRNTLSPERFPSMTVNGSPSTLVNEIAFCVAYGMEIELIQPVSESPFMDWLRAHGPGIQHIAFIPSNGFQAEMDHVKALTGKGPWIRGQDPDIGMDFSYFDLQEELGFFVELHNEDRSEAPGNDY